MLTIFELYIVYTYSIESLDLCDIIIQAKRKQFAFTTKNPEVSASGFFYSVCARWLMPQADCLFSSIQPFADSISDYARHDGGKERKQFFHYYNLLSTAV